MAKRSGPYAEKVIDHFRNPHNYGKMEDADGVGKVGNVACGDVMWLYIKVKREKDGVERITDASFETYGCVAAIASSSEITDMAKGKTLDEALKIEKGEIVDSLGGLPPMKIHCSVLASDALAEAIYDHMKRGGREIPENLLRRHERIEEGRKKMEEMYGEWIEMEERMHNEK